MRVKELVDIIDGAFTISFKDGSKYQSESTIPEEVLCAVVVCVKFHADGIIINIEEPTIGETLKDLGYSFEVGG